MTLLFNTTNYYYYCPSACLLLATTFCQARFERSYLFGHHKRPQEAQWWSAGQRVLVLAGRATTPTSTTTTTATVPLGLRTSPASPAVSAVTLCAHPGRELRAFEAAARNLSAQLQLPQVN